MKNQIYIDNGYDDRDEYLESLSYEYEVPYDMVCAIADMLGPGEDFDGLVSAIKDYVEY